jgi:hypothetical protein
MSPLAIDLGDFNLALATSIWDVIWFLLGLVILTGLTAFVIRWNRREQPDPFE